MSVAASLVGLDEAVLDATDRLTAVGTVATYLVHVTNVHEGGWLMTPVHGADPLTPGYWRFDPPPPRPRPW